LGTEALVVVVAVVYPLPSSSIVRVWTKKHQRDDDQVVIRRLLVIIIGDVGLGLQHCTRESVALNLNVRLAGLVEGVCRRQASQGKEKQPHPCWGVFIETSISRL
jgi:hypothetical protein